MAITSYLTGIGVKVNANQIWKVVLLLLICPLSAGIGYWLLPQLEGVASVFVLFLLVYGVAYWIGSQLASEETKPFAWRGTLAIALAALISSIAYVESRTLFALTPLFWWLVVIWQRRYAQPKSESQ